MQATIAALHFVVPWPLGQLSVTLQALVLGYDGSQRTLNGTDSRFRAEV